MEKLMNCFLKFFISVSRIIDFVQLFVDKITSFKMMDTILWNVAIFVDLIQSEFSFYGEVSSVYIDLCPGVVIAVTSTKTGTTEKCQLSNHF